MQKTLDTTGGDVVVHEVLEGRMGHHVVSKSERAAEKAARKAKRQRAADLTEMERDVRRASSSVRATTASRLDTSAPIVPEPKRRREQRSLQIRRFPPEVHRRMMMAAAARGLRFREYVVAVCEAAVAEGSPWAPFTGNAATTVEDGAFARANAEGDTQREAGDESALWAK